MKTYLSSITFEHKNDFAIIIKLYRATHQRFVALPSVPEKYQCLIKNRTKVFCLVFKFLSILNKAYLNLDLETKIVKIRRKLSEIYCFEVELIKTFKSKILWFFE